MAEEYQAFVEALSAVELDDAVPGLLCTAAAQVLVFMLRAAGQVATQIETAGDENIGRVGEL